MTQSHDVQIEKDPSNKRIKVTRYFDATPQQVWRAWTESELLDQWWAPRPWTAETKEMNFAENGYWLYAMVSPEGIKHWCKVEFKNIKPGKSFESTACFCDEFGNRNYDMPEMHWKNVFNPEGKGTIVVVNISFTTDVDFETIVKMGFEAGFTAGLNNLEEMISHKLLS